MPIKFLDIVNYLTRFILNMLVVLFSVSAHANIPLITDAALCDGGVSPRTEETKNAGFVMSDVLRASNVEVNGCLAYTNAGINPVWYDLDRSLKIHAVNITTKQYLGGWPLGTFVCAGADEDCDVPWWSGRWNAEEALENVVQNRLKDSGYPARYLYSEWGAKHTPGCMGQHPLRYGDIGGGSPSELVVVLYDSIVVFSTTLNKTVFSVMWNVDDWLSNEETLADVYGGKTKPEYPQYASKYLWSTNNGFKPAYRGYAKLFVGDFDEDEKSDIVVWRRLYESRLLSDSVKGFLPKGDTLVHYELLNGEYKKQDTEQGDINEWLSDESLTWQKGYPNLSECAGQKDKHIPEMIDPLLNDPDVLK